MLRLANEYKDQVDKLLQLSALKPKYKYYFTNGYADMKYKPKEDMWDGVDFVSVNDDEEVISFISIKFGRPYGDVTDIALLSSEESRGLDKIQDLPELFEMLFNHFGAPKIKWAVLIGNPVEKLYDFFIKRYGGRIVGVYEKNTLTLSGDIVDLKLYELLKENFKKH